MAAVSTAGAPIDKAGIDSLSKDMRALSLKAAADKTYELDYPADDRQKRILEIAKEILPCDIAYLVTNYVWDPKLKLFDLFRPYPVEPLLLTEPCPIAYASFEKGALKHLQAAPLPHRYFAARLVDTGGDKSTDASNCICDGEAIATHLERTFTNPLTKLPAAEINFFVTEGSPLFTLFRTCRTQQETAKVKNHIVANSLEKSREVQQARLAACDDSMSSDEDFIHLIQLLFHDEPNNPDGLHKLWIFITQGSATNAQDVARCQKRIEKTDMLFKNNPYVQNLLGDLYWNSCVRDGPLKPNRDKANAHYIQAIAIKPDMVRSLISLGRHLSLGHPVEKAKPYLLRAIALERDNFSAHVILGDVLTQLGELKEATAHYQHALQGDERDYDLHQKLGTVFRKRGALGDAKRHLERTLELDANNFFARQELRLISCENPEISEHEFFHTIQCLLRDIAYPSAYYSEALKKLKAFITQGSRDRSADVCRSYDRLEKIDRLFQAEPHVQDLIGRLFLHGNTTIDQNLRRAEIHYNKAIEKDPKMANSLAGLGELYRQRHDFEKAKDYLDRAIASSSHNSFAIGKLVEVMSNLNAAAK